MKDAAKAEYKKKLLIIILIVIGLGIVFGPAIVVLRNNAARIRYIETKILNYLSHTHNSEFRDLTMLERRNCRNDINCVEGIQIGFTRIRGCYMYWYSVYSEESDINFFVVYHNYTNDPELLEQRGAFSRHNIDPVFQDSYILFKEMRDSAPKIKSYLKDNIPEQIIETDFVLPSDHRALYGVVNVNVNANLREILDDEYIELMYSLNSYIWNLRPGVESGRAPGFASLTLRTHINYNDGYIIILGASSQVSIINQLGVRSQLSNYLQMNERR
ncbi:MAG: hypothetical protein FWC79_05595 [Oscillospiraceae bacterium]|nr:hypothetical protein [Oscillospiraceae bacterium]